MSEKICRNCGYYKPDYGMWCANGWSKNGSSGYCNVEPKGVYVTGGRIGCRYWEAKS